MRIGVRLLSFLMTVLLLSGAAAQGSTPAYTFTNRSIPTTYETETIKYQIEIGLVNGTKCYLTKVWLAEPGRQIRKAISPWHEELAWPQRMAAKIDGVVLAVNGSGYVSPTYPEIPGNYPGNSKDYYYTPLGSLTVVDGKVYRNLEGVPFYGLTLEADGLHMYSGSDNEQVLANNPLQTWSFYTGCPMARDGISLIDEEWAFATRRAARTIVCKLKEENTYLLMTATSNHGLTLVEANTFLMAEYDTEWIYDLDGGPSSALMRKRKDADALKVIYEPGQRCVDVLAFTE